MHPFKHYETSVIESELDHTRDDCPADNATINRWKQSFKAAQTYVEGCLMAIQSQVAQEQYPLLTDSTILAGLKAKGPGWLGIVNRQLIKSGNWAHTQFAFCP